MNLPTITFDEVSANEEPVTPDPHTTARSEAYARMQTQRNARYRAVPFQSSRGGPIVTHNLPKAKRPTGKQIRKARKLERQRKQYEADKMLRDMGTVTVNDEVSQ